MATNNTKTLTWQEMDAMATEVVRYLLSTPQTQALNAWSAALHAVDCLHEMDRTWPLVRERLDRAEFERRATLIAREDNRREADQLAKVVAWALVRK